MLLAFLYYVVILLCLCKFVTVVTKGYCKSNVCLIGRTVLVTGGNSGMGYQISLSLASRGARVIIADIADTTNSILNIKAKTKNEDISGIYLDLSNFASVRKCVKNFLSEEKRLDILINNAGCAGFSTKTDDGIFKVMQINHLGHFLLTHLLTPLLKQTSNSRVVFVSSLVAFANDLSCGKDLNRLSEWPLIKCVLDYGNSKICVLAAAKIFARRLAKCGIIVSSCHPGIVNTTLFATSFSAYVNDNKVDLTFNLGKGFIRLLVGFFSKTIFEGIQATLHCALSSRIRPGDFIIDGVSFPVPPKINDEQFITNVWNESVRLTGLTKDQEIS